MRVAVVSGARTPFVKALTTYKDISAVELGTHAVDGVFAKSGLDPAKVDALAYGWVVIDTRTPHMAREIGLKSRLPATVPALTLTDNCITGTSAITSIADTIALGRIEVGIAGGVESMSNASLVVSDRLRLALRGAQIAKSTGGMLKSLASIRPGDLLPSAPGVEEPSTGLSMGEHTELMVKEWSIAREPQDELALRSHHRAAAAHEAGKLGEEIVPLAGVDRDTIVRPGTTIEKLAKLKPVFDKQAGTLTAGNSSPLTDGAAATLLMSEARAEAEGLEPLAFVKAVKVVAIDPADGLLMGPGVAVPQLLKENGLTLDDIDLVEMHEAFAGQVLCNLAAWEQGWKEEAIGTVDVDKLNVNGSSLAIGHPFAATGSRIVNGLALEMKRRDAKYGLISICAAGAQAVAMLLER